MNKFLIILASITISLSAYSQINTSKWISTPLTIDGKNIDWEGNRPSCYSTESMILYELKNNSDYLFLVFEITDKRSQAKFMHAGFEIAMKVKTKPRLKASINFLPQQMKERSMQKVESVHNTNEATLQTYILNSSYAEVSGFLKTNGMINRNISGTEEFTYNIGWNDLDNMLIEIQIPISEVFTTAIAEVDYTKIPIRLICKLNALERPSGEQMRSGDSGMRGRGSSGGRSGGGRSNGGGGRTGGHGASSGDMQTMSDVQTFKAKYVLSKGN